MTQSTPIEPGWPQPGRVGTLQAVHATLFGRVVAAAASSRGSPHRVNEDAHSPLQRHGRVFVVADGVGGGAMAALASRELVRCLHGALDGRRIGAAAVGAAVLAADRAVAGRIAELTDAPGAATLALCAAMNPFASRWLVAWVGDCRAYRIAAGAAQALTVDDSFVQLAETPPPGSAPEDPARMVGNGAVVQANVTTTGLARGELLLLCTDGVHKHLGAADIVQLCGGDRPLVDRCDALVGLARCRGSHDDATALLVQRSGAPGAAR